MWWVMVIYQHHYCRCYHNQCKFVTLWNTTAVEFCRFEFGKKENMIFSALSLSCFVGLGNTKDRDIQPKIECPAVIHPHSLGEILFSSSSEPSVCMCQDVWRWDGRPDQEVPNKKHLFNPRFKINKLPTSSHFYFFPNDYESVTIIWFQVLRAIGTGGLHSFTRHGGLHHPFPPPSQPNKT